MSEIIYPNLKLFLYDLRNSLGETESEFQQRQENFRNRLPESVRQLMLPEDKAFEVSFRRLLGETATADFSAERNSYKLEGYYYPVRINDVYGLLVDCSVDRADVSQPTACFATLKEEIEQNPLLKQPPTQGQTWMMYGQLPEGSTKTPTEIARDCYKYLMPEAIWEDDLQGQGKLMGADIFELSQYNIVMQEAPTAEVTIQDIQENRHVIIIVYPDRTTAERSAKLLLNEWMNLFCDRHKILWCYGQSQQLKKDIKNHFQAIEASQKFIQEERNGEELKALKKMLKFLHKILYTDTINLDYLNFQILTIDINLEDYEKRITKMTNLLEGQRGESNLSFLREFSDRVTKHYRLQIDRDIAYLQKGMKMLNDAIATAGSRVEVEKAARDKNFQDLVTIAGVGLTVGAIAAEIKPDIESKYKLSADTRFSVDAIDYYVTALSHPLGFAIAAAFLTWLIKYLWRSGSD